MDVEQVTTPLSFVKRYLLDNSIFPGYTSECAKCTEQPKGCDDLKAGIQLLIKEASLQFDRKSSYRKVTREDVVVISIPYTPVRIPTPSRAPPLMITVPGPMPYTSEKAIPWHYGADVYYHGVKQEVNARLSEEERAEGNEEEVHNFSGVGRMTRSGRVFGPLNVQDAEDASAREKGKQQAMIGNPRVTLDNVTQPIMRYVKRYLIDNFIFPGCTSECAECREQSKGCVDLKAGIQLLIKEGFL